MSHSYSHHFRVYLEDTDAGGIVYHANHLKFFERCRREWLRSLGIEHYTLSKGYQFVLHSSNIAYKKPLLMDDYIEVTLTLTKLSTASLELQQAIYKQNISTSCTTAKIKLACVDDTLKPTAIPEQIKQALSNKAH